MVDNVFIKAAKKAAADQAAAAEIESEHKLAQFRRALPKFEKNVTVWLGELENDESYQPGTSGIETYDAKTTDYSIVAFTYNFTWYGMKGEIVSRWWGSKKDSLVHSQTLIFELPNGERGKVYSLPVARLCEGQDRMNYEEEAVPVNPAVFGAYLLQQMSYMDSFNEQQERNKINMLISGSFVPAVRACATSEEVDALVADWVEKVPERWHVDLAFQGTRRKDEIQWGAKKQATEQLIQERIEAYQAAKDRLEKQLDAMFVPFTLYELEYAIGDDPERNLTNTCWAISPDTDHGWWQVLEEDGTVVGRTFSYVAAITRWEIKTRAEIHNHPGLYSKLKKIILTEEVKELDQTVEVAGRYGWEA